MSLAPQTILGRDLCEGDVVDLWFGRHTIVSLSPYIGPLAYLWERHGGARIATFAAAPVGMTIEPIAQFTVLNRLAARPT